MKISLVCLLLAVLVCTSATPVRKRHHHSKQELILEELLQEIEKVEDERATSPPRRIFANGLVYTVNPNDPKWHENPKEAIVVEGKKILYVGSTTGADQYWTDNTEWRDLKGATILPGLHDVHQHPMETNSLVGATCILDGTKTLVQLAAYISSSRCADGPDEWALGHGHDITMVLDYLKTGDKSPAALLDTVIPNKPAVMMEATSHSMWVNTAALRKMGFYSASPPNVTGGIIWMDDKPTSKTYGKPNGILLENAGNVVMSMALASNPINDQGNYVGLKNAMKILNENGITSVVDARAYWQRGHDRIWKKLLTEEPNQFTVRAILDLWAAPELEDDYQLDEIAKRYSNDENSLLRMNGVKVYIDGLLPTTTAAMKNPYLVNYGFPGIKEKNIGINYFTQERLTKYMNELQNLDDLNKGFDFNVHSIGDRGVYEVLNAIERSKSTENLKRPARHRLTHVEVVDPADYNRFKQLNAIADFQVAGDFTMKPMMEENEEFIGNKYLNFVPVNSIASTGAMVSFSSDWDVSDVNPFIGLQHSFKRGQQSVTLKKAIEMYTINAAYVMRQEQKVGSLVAGKEADFIVIDQDILDPINEEYIECTKVFETVLQGKTVYKDYSQNTNCV